MSADVANKNVSFFAGLRFTHFCPKHPRFVIDEPGVTGEKCFNGEMH